MTNYAFIDYLVRRLRQLNQRMRKKITYIKMRNFRIQRIKYLFISIKVKLVTINNVIPYIPKTNSTSSSLKKKKKPQERERKRKKRWEREEGKGKKGRETEKEGEEEGREKERKRECERKGK